MGKLAPVLRPLAERNQQEARVEYEKRERAIDDETAGEFGKDFDSLRKQSTDPKFIERVLQQSPMGPLIIGTHDRSPALAHRLLLREIREFNRRVAVQKGKKSVPADIGSKGKPVKRASSASIEDAWDASVGEGGEE
jgi:hypothetical protein